MNENFVAILTEGLSSDMRPACYGCSTWDIPFLDQSLFSQLLNWLEQKKCRHIILLDDTPQLYMRELAKRCPLSTPVQHIDARTGSLQLLEDIGAQRVYLFKPCAILEPDIDALEAFHEISEAQATFALTRLEPEKLTWPYIPDARLDEFGGILEVDKLRRTDALSSANLDNILGTTAPTRPREFWAPRNVAILEIDVALKLPIKEFLAPLAGLARELVAQETACYGTALQGKWWPASTCAEVMRANHEALTEPLIASDARIAKDATIHASVIGERTQVEAHAKIHNSVVADRCRLGAHSTIENTFIGSQTALPEKIHLASSAFANGEVQSLTRGVPPGGIFVDGLRNIDEPAVLDYWRNTLPMPGRSQQPSIVETLSRGLDNSVYHIFDENRHYVLKRRLDCRANPLIREFHVLRALSNLRDATAPRKTTRKHTHRKGDTGKATQPPPTAFAPRPYVVDLRPEIHVAPCIVMEFVRGKAVPRDIDADTAASIARTCLEVHSLPVDTLLADLPELAEQSYPDLLTYVTELAFQYGTFLDLRRNMRNHEDALGENMARLVKTMQQMAERENIHWTGFIPRALCQGDLRDFNMVIRDDDPQTVVLLDWERAGIDDPAYDIAWFMALAELTPKADHAFREAYGAGPPGDKSFWQRVEGFRLADVLTWPLHLLRLATEYREKKENRAAAYEESAYRALATAFNALSKSALNGFSGEHNVQTVREMGNLFA